MDFDPRIGRRYQVHDVPALWEPHLDAHWVKRLRHARGEDQSLVNHNHTTANARIQNVSVSGAGVMAPADRAVIVGTPVTVLIGPGSHFEAVIRRVQPAEEMGWAYFGVEFTSISEGFGSWLDQLMSTQHVGPIPDVPQVH